RRGRKPVHSWEKPVCICIIMVILGLSLRDMQNVVPNLNLPWSSEPYPDHSYIDKAFNKLDEDYLDLILEKTAYLCIKETSWKKGVLGVDSSGVETDRYELVERPNKKKGCFEEVRRQIYLKYHIVAILDYLIILRAKATSSRTSDSPVLRSLLNNFQKMKGSVFDADKGYDAEANFKRVFELLMHPNIKQRLIQKGPKGVGHKRLRYRSRAAKIFDEGTYHYRGMIEAIFGAEETDGHNLSTRFRIKKNQEIWGKILAIGWNLKVLNRLRSASQLGMRIAPTIRN
ncbi:MAG: transposase, partial [Leptospirales bacterium]